jgi:hypothetical protein
VGSYQVEVTASNSTGTSAWSNPVAFSVAPAAPARPTVTGPTSATTAAPPTFTWTASAGAAQYWLWVDNATTGQQGVIQQWDLTTTSYTPATALAAGTYHVFAQAVDSNGNRSGWSAEMDFTVASALGGATGTGPTSATTLATSLATSTYGQSITLTATVAAATGTGTPTGTVTFKDGATVLGTATLSSGKATLATAQLRAGSHSITAVYAGNSTFAGSTSATVAETVKKAATTTTLTASASTAVFGQAITLTAKVAVVAPGAGVPSGTVTFKDGSTVLGTGTLINGVATFRTAKLAVGSHAITAVYGGDSSFTASTSAALTQTVIKAATTTMLTSSANTAVVGQLLTLTAKLSVVAPGAAAPSGTVTFKDGTTVLGTGTVSNGVVTLLTAKLSKGQHTLTAVYTGDGDLTGSTSLAVTVTIN